MPQYSLRSANRERSAGIDPRNHPGGLAANGARTARLTLIAAAAGVALWCGMPQTASAAGSQAPVSGASDYVSSRPASLHASPHDAFARQATLSDRQGLSYVPYERTYKGLAVVGGDFVVVTDRSGRVLSTSVAQQRSIDVATTPSLTSAQAAAIARRQLPQVDRVQSTQLVVDATAAKPRLAYESLVIGSRGGLPSRLHVLVDAADGNVLSTSDDVRDGTGTGAINGPAPLTINTSGSGPFSMADPTRASISCRDYNSRAVLTGSDDLWGNGVGTDRETGCVDALWDVQRQWDMLGSWLGRNGINGSGSGFPIYLGLNDLNAYWDGSAVTIGHNADGQWISSLDVVGHEFGHAIDSTTPGGQSANGVSEATGDIFGALTESYANEPAAYDPPDFQIGEEINLVGSGPIRVMYNPSLVGDPNCYSSSIPSMETHAAAGPFDHWFYLLAEGTAPTDGQPASPTCNGSSIAGIGVRKAASIFYSAMLSKTSSMTYLRYRTATLNAAKNSFPGSCAEFNAVKAAWDAVLVPVQAGDPTCSTTPPPPPPPPPSCTQTTAVPDLYGYTRGEAGTALALEGLTARFTGSSAVNAWVSWQTPRFGTIVPCGSTVTLTMMTGMIP